VINKLRVSGHIINKVVHTLGRMKQQSAALYYCTRFTQEATPIKLSIAFRARILRN
jgi:hypothetical protein